MTQALSQMTPRHVLPMADTQTDTTVRVFTNRLEEGSDFRRRALPARLAPTDAQRDLMASRVAQIDRWLAPSRQAAIIRAVGMVRGAMAVPAGASDDVFSIYVEVLRPFPEPVVEDVCRRYLDGRLGNRVYAPTPAEIAHECRLAVSDALAERGKIALILDAEVYATPTEEERQEVEAQAAALIEELAQAARQNHADNLRNNGPVTPTGSASSARAEALKELADRKAKREAEQSSLSAQLKAGYEPFETERKGEAA
jgi:sarcosine oxidase gamma subunit